MRILSWNIRAGGGKRKEEILDQLFEWEPDILGLCEFRGTPASQWLAVKCKEKGLQYQIMSTNPNHLARNSLLLASRFPLTAVHAEHMPTIPERWILAQVDCKPKLTIGLMHIPNYTSPTLKYPFMDAILDMIDTWPHGPAILMGDTNCGKRGIDEEKPSPPRFHREHDWLVGIEARGWLDLFRHKHGDQRTYSWYSHRNNGFRLDYGFGSPHFRHALLDIAYHWGHSPTQPGRRDALSDHAALLMNLDLSKID